LYFGREYRLVLLDNVQVNELRFERVTVADKILAGRLRLTGDMAIVSEDGRIAITSRGIEMDTTEGGTKWTPGGIVFHRPDGTRSGYVRAIVPGVAKDGDYVQLNFINEPVIVLTPASAITYYEPAGGTQKLRLEALNASPDGFEVSAKLVRHDGQGSRTVFPKTSKYSYRPSGTSTYCTDNGHTREENARAWSPHRMRDVNETRIFTTSPGTTGVIIRIWEMMHVHAYAGNYTATNRITYRLRIREKGSGTWLQTLGPYTRSITATSSLFSTRLNW